MSTPDGTPTDGDSALARAWREASGDEPPERVDDAIRAAAHRAVRAGPSPAERSFVRRWRVPLSIAALVVLSASLTLMLTERDVHLPTAATSTRKEAAPALGDAAAGRLAREVPAAAGKRGAAPAGGTMNQPPLSTQPESAQSRVPAAGATAPPAHVPARESAEGERKDVDEGAVRRKADSPDAAQQAPALASEPTASAKPGAPASVAPATRQEAAPAAEEAEPAAEPMKKRESAPGLESFMREAQTPGEGDELPGRARLKLQARPAAPAPFLEAEPAPEQWVERIRELRRQGLLAEAEASLEQFRERYPDFALPADLAPPSREH